MNIDFLTCFNLPKFDYPIYIQLFVDVLQLNETLHTEILHKIQIERLEFVF